MAAPTLLKEAGEIREKINVKRFLEQELWEGLPGRSEAPCEGALAFSPHGRFLAVGLQDGRVGIWDFDTTPHLSMVLELPEHLEEKKRRVPFHGESKDVEEYADYVVRGLAWADDATKLLATLREDDQDHYFCLWDLVEATLLHCQAWNQICGVPQLIPSDSNKVLLCTGPGEVSILDLKTGSTRQVELAADEAGRRETAKSKLPGACVVARDGRTVFCSINRKLYKFDCAECREIARSRDNFGLINIPVARLILSPDDTLVLACTSRGGFLFDAETLSLVQSLGGTGVQVDWADWGFGCNNTIIAIPMPITYNSKQESMFSWVVEDLSAVGPEVKKLPREGLSAIAVSPMRPVVVSISQKGGLYMHRETFSTTFPGPMYPKGYVVIDTNVTYLEKEDELDKEVKRIGKGAEEAKRREERLATKAAEAKRREVEAIEQSLVDIVTIDQPSQDEEESEAEDFLRPHGWGGEENVNLFTEIRPLVVDKAEEKKGEAEEEGQDEGDKRGLPGLFPMPRQARKRTEKGAKKPCVAAEHGRAAVRAALHRVVNKGVQPKKPTDAPPALQAAPPPLLAPQGYHFPHALPIGYYALQPIQAAMAWPGMMQAMKRHEKRPRVEWPGAVLPQASRPHTQVALRGVGAGGVLASSDGFVSYLMPPSQLGYVSAGTGAYSGMLPRVVGDHTTGALPTSFGGP